MCPYERHRATRWSPVEQVTLGNIVAVPHLLRNQPARARLGGYRLSESPGDIAPAGGELVVRAFADQQRPAAADAGAVERRAILVLAVPVAVIPTPHRTGCGLALEQMIDDGDRVDDARIVRGA